MRTLLVAALVLAAGAATAQPNPAGIHWQALRLWWKGVPVVPRVTRNGVGERAAHAAASAGRTNQPTE